MHDYCVNKHYEILMKFTQDAVTEYRNRTDVDRGTHPMQIVRWCAGIPEYTDIEDTAFWKQSFAEHCAKISDAFQDSGLVFEWIFEFFESDGGNMTSNWWIILCIE